MTDKEKTYATVKLAKLKLLERIDAHIHRRAEYWQGKEDILYGLQEVLNETGEIWQELVDLDERWTVVFDPETGKVLEVKPNA